MCCLDPANESLFSMFNPSDDLIEAKLIRRGLIQDNMSNYDESNVNTTDLAILLLEKPIEGLSSNELFDPKLNSLLPKSNDIPMNSQLFLISYNGELTDNNELNPNKDEKGFENVTIDKLNFIIMLTTNQFLSDVLFNNHLQMINMSCIVVLH